MRIEVNYQGKMDPILEKKIRLAMQKELRAKQFSHGFRGDEAYLWFDYQGEKNENSKIPI